MRSRRNAFAALLRKDARELFASRAYWLLLVMVGPLVGHAFITGVALYAEASGTGDAAALPQGLSPLDGILVPTLGAYDLAVTLLFPFVPIRLVAAEKESGAWKLLLQSPLGPGVQLVSKALVLLTGWLLAWVPGLLALLLWRLYGGHLHLPETLTLLLGHLVRVAVATGVAVAAAALAESAASAAIVALGFTLGTWALDFVAAGRGGLLASLARFTPAAVLRQFEQGLLPLASLLCSLLVAAGGFAVAAVWLRTGLPLARRAALSAAVVAVLAVAGAAASALPQSWDLSEDRRGSFSRADEAALRAIPGTLTVTVRLAPEDPRLLDLERGVLNKLRRTRPGTRVVYTSTSRTGLFEGSGEGGESYGEVWYELDGRRAMTRSTTEPIVLEEIYKLAGGTRPESLDPAYPGYPLAARPRGAALLYFALWPTAAGLTWILLRSSWS